MKLKAISESGIKVANPGVVVGKVQALARTLQGENPKKDETDDETDDGVANLQTP